MSELTSVAVEKPATTSMVMAVIPDGVMPGSVFNISTPSGAVMAVTCPPTSKPGDQIHIAVPAGPAVTPGLELAVEKEDLVRVGKVTKYSFPKKSEGGGFKAELPVTGGTGTQIGVVHLRTCNVLKEPCTVQLVSPSGETLMSYEVAGLSERWKSSSKAAVVPVQLSGHLYASCTDTMRQVGGKLESTTRVTRVDGSGGTLIEPIESGCGSARCYLLTLGIVLWVFVIGIFFMCAAYAMPVTGRVKSLDGTAEYAPHGDARGVKTVNFVPDPKDKKRDSYKTYDAKTKVDALVAIMMTAVNTALAWTQETA